MKTEASTCSCLLLLAILMSPISLSLLPKLLLPKKKSSSQQHCEERRRQEALNKNAKTGPAKDSAIESLKEALKGASDLPNGKASKDASIFPNGESS